MKGHSSIVKKSFSETQGRLDWTMRFCGRCDIFDGSSYQEREIDNLVPMGKALGTGMEDRVPEHLLSPLNEPVPLSLENIASFRPAVPGSFRMRKKFFFLVFVLLGRWKVAATRNGRKHYNTSYGSEVNGRWTRKRILYKSTFEKK